MTTDSSTIIDKDALLRAIADHAASTKGYKTLMKRGKKFSGRALPSHYEPMEPKKCFENAYELKLQNGTTLTYYDGLGAFTIAGQVFVTPHGWCVENDTGLVVDPTWTYQDITGIAYVGTPRFGSTI